MEKCCSGFVVVALLACALQAQTARPGPSEQSRDPEVTAVTGKSWLIHIKRSFDDTSMGKTGRLGPAPEAEPDSPPISSAVSMHSANETVTLRGSDLYRLNCQPCHGETGAGAPPEINSVINPVRGTSVTLVQENMRNRGLDISPAAASKLAQEASTSLSERLHKGGENMPAFPQLKEAEVRSLLSYLKQLAGIPGAQNQQTSVKESHVRVGELIVKSTCHTCHSATGPNPGPQQLLDGAIPPLSSLTTRKSQSEFIRKVTQGAPVLMGAFPMPYRGRMPVFYYISEEEAADVYLYLTLYPPSGAVTSSPVVAASENRQPPMAKGPVTPPTSSSANAKEPESARRSILRTAALVSMIAIAALLLVGGLVFTFREFKRLYAESSRPNTVAKVVPPLGKNPRPPLSG